MKDESSAGSRIFLFWTIVLILVISALGYNGLYGQDSYEYLRFTIRLADFLSEGISPGYYFWPVNYPLLGALFSFICSASTALQLLSVISAAWIVYLLCTFLFHEFPGREQEIITYVILFLGLSPYFFRYAISSMSDITALSFACTAFFTLYKGCRFNRDGFIYASWFFVSMSVFTRFAFLPLLAPVIICSGWLMLKRFRFNYFIISFVTALIPLFIYLYIKEDNASGIFHHYLVTDWSLLNYFRNSFVTEDGTNNFILPNLIFVFAFLVHPGFIFTGVFFLYVLFGKRPKPSFLFPVMIAGMILYLLFIAGIPSRNSRYLIPLLPFYVLICFPAYLKTLSWLFGKRKMKIILVISAFIVQIILVAFALRPFLMMNRLEKSIAETIIDYHPEVIYTFGIDGAISSYGFQGKLINMWEKPVDTIVPGSLMLFNTQIYEKQWKGKNPMLNFQLLIDKGKALQIEELESGWKLYEIKKAYPDPDPGIPKQ